MDEKKLINICDFLTDKMRELLAKHCIQNNISIDIDKANAYFQQTSPKRFMQIIAIARNDGRNADSFSDLEKGNITPLVKQAMILSINHECLDYAKEIVNHAKI